MLSQIKKTSFIRFIASSLIFILFLWLVIKANYADLFESNLPVNIFLKLDPFAVYSSFIADRTFELSLFLLASVLVVLTLLFGRFFCSWICPLGYLNQLISRIRFKEKKTEFHKTQYFKYYFLVFLLLLAVGGVQVAGIADPISIMTRSITFAVIPAGAFILNSFLDVAYDNPILNHTYKPVKTIYDYLFYNSVYHFEYSILLGIIFVIILLLNFYRNRFWCNQVCPLGALFGLLAHFSIFKVKQDDNICTGCQICTVNCHGNANPHIAGDLRHSECMLCGNCLDNCPSEGLQYRPAFKTIDRSFQPERRELIITGVLSLISIPAVRFISPSEANAHLIRPPGSLEEESFLNRCISCGKCAKVCPNNAIHLTLTEAGLEGIFTPRIIPRLGYCEYLCNLCSQVCPTGAIRPISLEEKEKIVIGKAKIDKTLCKVYANNEPCLVCEEHCPVPDKAIKLISGTYPAQPVVDSDLCIGCGICEYKCPIEPQRAIVVEACDIDRSKVFLK
jgi:polyferredoxin